MEHIFRNCLLTLYEQPHADVSNVLDLLSNKAYREQAVRKLQNKTVKEFWMREFAKYNHRYCADAMAPIQNKVGAFLAHPIVKAILAGANKRPEHNLSLRRMMDKSQVLLVNLSKGKLGEDASKLIGGLLINSVGLAAYSRADIPEFERVPFMLYADEFQNFKTLSLVNMASELRKYKVGMTLAHQYRE